MKKLIFSLMVALLSFGSAAAFPRFKGLDNKNGKTTVRIEIPAYDRDSENGLSIDNVKLYNDGKVLKAKKVDAIWGDNSTVLIEFKKLTKFDNCTLSLTVNGKPVSLHIDPLTIGREVEILNP